MLGVLWMTGFLHWGRGRSSKTPSSRFYYETDWTEQKASLPLHLTNNSLLLKMWFPDVLASKTSCYSNISFQQQEDFIRISHLATCRLCSHVLYVSEVTQHTVWHNHFKPRRSNPRNIKSFITKWKHTVFLQCCTGKTAPGGSSNVWKYPSRANPALQRTGG